MARQFTAASSHKLTGSSMPVTAPPFTMACWFMPNDVTNEYTLMSIGDTAANNDYFALTCAGQVAGDPVRAYTKRATNSSASTTTGYSANVWNHACGVWAGAADRRAYVNGGSKGTETTSKIPTGLDTFYIGTLAEATPALFMDGRIAEACIWNIALSDTEVAALAKGIDPRLIQPDSLIFYAPLFGRYSPETDRRSTVTLTVTGAVAASHPPMRRGRAQTGNAIVRGHYAVPTSRVIKWNTKATVATSRTLKWNTKATVATSRVLKWNTKAAIAISRILKWNTKRTIATSRTLKWNTDATVAASKVLRWNTRVAVPLSRTLKWNFVSDVPLSRTLKWNTKAPVPVSRALLWDTRATVPVSRVLLWNFHSVVSTNRVLKWNTETAVATSRVLKWNTRAGVPVSRVVKWNTKARVPVSRALLWDTKVSVSLARVLKWIVEPAEYSTELTLQWYIPEEVETELALQWAVQGYEAARLGLQWAVQPSPARIHAALGTASVVNGHFVFERRTLANLFLEDLTAAFTGGSYECNNDRAIFRTATFNVDALALATLNPLRDVVGIDYLLTVDGGYQTRIPCGLFQLDIPRTQYAVSAASWEIEASGVVSRLASDYPSSTYVVAAGTNYVTAMRAILDAAGLRHAIPATTKTLPIARPYDVTQSWLEIVNDLGSGINYYGIWDDENGIIVTRESVEMDRVTEAVVYTADDFITSDPIADEADTTRMANKIIAYSDNPDRTAPLSVSVTNADPDSPISTVNIGRVITKTFSIDSVSDTTVLTSIATQKLSEAASLYRRVSLTSKLDPRRGAHEVLRLQTAEYPDDVYWARNFKFDLDTGAAMKWELARVERVAAS